MTEHKNQLGNTAEWVLNRLRNAIVSGMIPANQPLRQDRIAEELGVSKVPVREALVQLKSEGLVVFKSNRGAVVSELSSAEADEIFTMRLALETTALKRAIPNLTASDLIRAESALQIIEQEGNRAEWGRLNWEFHSNLYQAAHMPRLLTTIRTLNDNVARYLIIHLAEEDYQKKSQKEHWLMLKACREKKIREAVTVLKTHIQFASARLVAVLNQQKTVQPDMGILQNV